MAGTETYRLPRSAWPRRYQLVLRPELAAARFSGTATVTLDLVEAVSALTLNAADLTLGPARIESPDGEVHEGTVSVNAEEQQATISVAATLPPAEGYRLHVDFEGLLNDHLHGFYRSTFRDVSGAEQVIATTQFEPTDARRAFPCWDEPEFKSTFAITLVVDEGLTALSNGAVESDETDAAGQRRITFSETMTMSTYLVAFVVGAFLTTEPADVDGVPLRIAAVDGRMHLTGHAERAGIHALRFLSNYFEIPYPGDKIDHVAVPDFAFGAMENLGCVTYRENALLADVDMASQVELQRIATVVAHETAHMWFGDLVTMKWWNGIWLNEAFATFMELTTSDDFNPGWQVWTAFGVGKSAALAIDGLRATRPVEYPVGRPEEAQAMFDVLTYQKGGAVLKMLEQYLGPETFRKGISHYLSTHSYGNTETTDLWDAIEMVSGQPVRSIMDSWIQQGGYPLVRADVGSDPATVTLRQRRFLYDGRPGDQCWAVPVNLRASVAGSLQHQRILLDGESATMTFDGPVDWVVVNDGAWGFYRVGYSAELLARIKSAGLADVLGPLERLALVADSWASVVEGSAELADWVSVVEALGGDDDPDVWAAITAVLGLLAVIGDEDDLIALHAFVRRIAEPVWRRLGWEPKAGESKRAATARARVLTALGLSGAQPDVRQEVAKRMRRFLEDRTSLAPDLVAAASRIYVAGGDEESWSDVLAAYRRTTEPQDKIRYLFALSEPGYEPLLLRTLDLCLTPDVRTQDAPFLISAVMAHREGDRVAWEWVEQHWDELRARFPGDLIIRMFEGISSLVDPELAAAVHRFCDTRDVPSAGPRLAQMLERMDINVALGRRLRGTLSEVLNS